MMTRKAKVKIKQRAAVGDEELRRWCIEQAIRWPMVGSSYSGGMAFSGGEREADVIERAERLLTWVKS
jgi:hypothetical protein